MGKERSLARDAASAKGRRDRKRDANPTAYRKESDDRNKRRLAVKDRTAVAEAMTNLGTDI